MKKLTKTMVLCGIALFSGIFLSGCGVFGESQSKKNKDYCEAVYTAFCENNAEAISPYFCKQSQDTHELNKEIEGAFDFIDGKILSYEHLDISTGGDSVRNGEVILCDSSPKIEGIKTDSGHIYDILINNREICVDEPDIEGFSVITVFEVDPNDRYNYISEYKIGEYIKYVSTR